MANESYLIECKIKRRFKLPDGTPAYGSDVRIGKKTYKFRPKEDGAHVCAVEDASHVERLLRIPEAYRLYRPDSDDDDAVEQVAATDPGDPGFDVVTEMVGDDDTADAGSESDGGEDIDPLIAEAMSDPVGASNRAIERWAKSRGINAASKKAIEDYGRTHFGVDLDRRNSPVNMLRDLIAAELSDIDPA